jgi:hypothetical protein
MIHKILIFNLLPNPFGISHDRPTIHFSSSSVHFSVFTGSVVVPHNVGFQPPGNGPETEKEKTAIPGRLESFVGLFL